MIWWSTGLFLKEGMWRRQRGVHFNGILCSNVGEAVRLHLTTLREGQSMRSPNEGIGVTFMIYSGLFPGTLVFAETKILSPARTSFSSPQSAWRCAMASFFRMTIFPLNLSNLKRVCDTCAISVEEGGQDEGMKKFLSHPVWTLRDTA